MNCPVCNSINTEFIFVKNNLNIADCVDCGHRFTVLKQTPENISKEYSDDYFFNGGAGYDNYTLEKDMLIKRGEYYANKVQRFINTGKVLDIGAAAGFLLKGFENKGWKGTGIEPNRTMVEYAKKVMNIDLKNGTLETAYLEEKFDLVMLIQVVAHLYDIRTSFDQIYHFLKSNGYVLIETWDKDSFTAKLFGSNWHEYSPPGTLNYFSRNTLERLMMQHGFTLIKQGTPKKSIHSRHAKSLIKHKLSESKNLKWMAPLALLIPGNMILPYPSEDLFWALYKKN